jgi:hypothetical protein
MAIVNTTTTHRARTRTIEALAQASRAVKPSFKCRSRALGLIVDAPADRTGFAD